MRHLLILASLGFMFTQCNTESTSDTSVYNKAPKVITESNNTSEAETAEANEAAEADRLAAEQTAKEAEDQTAKEAAEKEAKTAADKEAASKKAIAAKAAAAKKAAADKAAAAKKAASNSAAKTDSRIRPTPREDKISTDIVSNPKTASSTPRKAVPKPVIKWQTKVHDFGWINEGEKVKFSYHFKNVGNEPLIILEATADCGCTVPSYSKRPVPPGGSGSLDVIFDSKSKAGRQDKKITILANTIPNYSELRIQGMVDNRPKKDDKSAGSGTTTKPSGTTSQPNTAAKSGGSLLDKLKNKVDKDN